MEIEKQKQALLFVYGTGLDGFEHATFLKESNRSHFIGYGTVQGVLYDTGTYPAFLPSENGRATAIEGEIYALDEPWTVLGTLDIIEGFNETHPERSLFIRKPAKAQLKGTEIDVYIYIYNQSIKGFPQITSGSYRKYIQEEGRENSEKPDL